MGRKTESGLFGALLALAAIATFLVFASVDASSGTLTRVVDPCGDTMADAVTSPAPHEAVDCDPTPEAVEG